jgi:hypothetical protein
VRFDAKARLGETRGGAEAGDAGPDDMDDAAAHRTP